MIPPNLLQLQKAPGFTVPAPAAPQAAPRPQGFLGGLRQFLTPERLRVIGAGLADLSNNGNSLPALLQQLDEQRAQLEQQRWQRIQQDQAIRGYKQQDAQQQAVDAWVQTLPPEQQRAAQLNPQAAVQAYTQQAFPRDQYQTLSPDEATAAGFRRGSVVQRGADGEMRVVQAPREFSPIQMGAGAAGGGSANDAAVNAMAQQMLENGGRPPPNLRNQALLARAWNRYAELLDASGRGNEGQVARQASVHASARALDAVRQRRGLMTAAEEAANRELELTQRLSSRVNLSNSPLWNVPMNQWRDRAQGNPDLIAFRNAALSASTEYARVLSGATGAGGITEGARIEAESMINADMSPAQIVAAIATMRQGMEYKNSELRREEEELLAEMQAGGGSPPPDADPAPGNTLGGVLRRSIRQGLSGNSPRVRTYNPSTGRLE